MRKVWDELFCQFFHGGSASLVSYSHLGAWRCARQGCRAQKRSDGSIAKGVWRPVGSL
jgi:hypothetical protein